MTNTPTTKSEVFPANAEMPVCEDIDLRAVLSFNLLRIFKQSSHPRWKLKALEIYACLNGLNASDQVRVQRNCSVSEGKEACEPQVEVELPAENERARNGTEKAVRDRGFDSHRRLSFFAGFRRLLNLDFARVGRRHTIRPPQTHLLL